MPAVLAECDDWTGPLDPYADLPYGSDVYPEPEPTDAWPTGVADADPGDPWPFQDAPVALLAGRVPVGSVRRRTRSQQLAGEYRAYLEARHGAAEDETRGNMVSRGGLARGVNGRRAWFSGRHASMRYATQELRDWFEVNGPCLTATEWRRQQQETPDVAGVPANHETEMQPCPTTPPTGRNESVSPGAGTPTPVPLRAPSSGCATQGARWTSRGCRYLGGPLWGPRSTWSRTLTSTFPGSSPPWWGPVVPGPGLSRGSWPMRSRCRWTLTGAGGRSRAGIGRRSGPMSTWIRSRPVGSKRSRPACRRRGCRRPGQRCSARCSPPVFRGDLPARQDPDIAGCSVRNRRMVRPGTQRPVSALIGQPILCPVCPGLRMIGLMGARIYPYNGKPGFRYETDMLVSLHPYNGASRFSQDPHTTATLR